MRKTPPRVLLALGWYDYRLHRGIERYAQQHGWHLSPNVAREKVIPWGWRGDGILAWLGAGDDLAEFVAQAGKPTVDFSFRRPKLRFPRVLADHIEVARLAAEHFLGSGLRHFLFYSAADNWAFEETGRGFIAVLRRAGHDCHWIRWHRSPAFTRGRTQWLDKRRWLAGELQKAPKPLAVLAASDDHAVEVLESCENAGLAVPEQVSIIGVDNSLLAVDAMHTPVSSVDTNLEMIGYRGAELLDHLMRGKPVPAEPVRVRPVGLMVRRSSDWVAVGHPGVARSLRYLANHFHEPISVDDLARAASMSRRGFHQAFLEHIGRPPGHEIIRVRIEQARQLLVTTPEKTAIIAGRCGYANLNSFWVAFRRAAGMSPTQYRRKFSARP